jgi:5-methylcytosine-specific restriction endonuclease McrA
MGTKEKESKMKIDYSKCLELNSAYMPTKIISSDRAFIVSLKGNAEIIHHHIDKEGNPIKFGLVNPELEIFRPSVIRTKKYFDSRFHHVKYSRENVFKRDDYTCVYCGTRDRKDCTIDHVIPQSKGGKDSFENCVTACKKCNQEKDDLTIKEWGREDPNPKRPHYLMILNNLGTIPEEWKKYLLW